MLKALDIRAELLRKGFTLAAFARRVGVHKSTVTRTLQGDLRSQSVVDALTSLLGVPEDKLQFGKSEAPQPDLTQSNAA